jgi:RNase P/RNase MRP subunit POP5
MTDKSRLASQVRRWALACLLLASPAAHGQVGGQIASLVPALTRAMAPSSDEILGGIERENNRRRLLLKEYSGSRQYTLQNERFGKQAAVAVLMSYRQVEGERYTVKTRSGSDTLNGIIDKVLLSEASASLPPERARHQITPANYRVRLLEIELATGRVCYVLELAPRLRNRFPDCREGLDRCRQLRRGAA